MYDSDDLDFGSKTEYKRYIHVRFDAISSTSLTQRHSASPQCVLLHDRIQSSCHPLFFGSEMMTMFCTEAWTPAENR